MRGVKLTNDEYINRLKEVNPYVKPLEDYQGSGKKIKHKCLIHNYTWEISPNNTLKGKGCPICKHDKLSKGDEQYYIELKEINSHMIPIETYKDLDTPILHKCILHNCECKVSPYSVLHGGGCAKCFSDKMSKIRLLTNDEYAHRLKTINSYVIPLETYKGAKIAIRHKCLIHNIEWNTTPGSVLKGGGCYMCSNEKISKKNKKDHDDYIIQLKNLDNNIICLDEYINSRIPIKHKCLLCNNIWEAAPGNILAGHGCPYCSLSIGEKTISRLLDENNIEYIPQYRFEDCKDIRSLPFDFYLIKLNKCIEFDGIQHFESSDFFGGEEKLKYTQLHDQIKDEYCTNNDIPLLRISYYEKDIKTKLENFIFN